MPVAITELEDSIHSLEASVSSTLPSAFAPLSLAVDLRKTCDPSERLETPKSFRLTGNFEQDRKKLSSLCNSTCEFVTKNTDRRQDICQKIQELYNLSKKFSRTYRNHLLSKGKKSPINLDELDELNESIYSEYFFIRGTIFLKNSLDLDGSKKTITYNKGITSLYQYIKREKSNILSFSKKYTALTSIFLISINTYKDEFIYSNRPSTKASEIVSKSLLSLDIFYELGLYTLIDEVNGNRVYLSEDSAEGKAIQRLEKIESGDDADWFTVIEEGQDVDVHSALERLKKRGYKINVSSAS